VRMTYELFTDEAFSALETIGIGQSYALRG
jgi:hypothetical protein